MQRFKEGCARHAGHKAHSFKPLISAGTRLHQSEASSCSCRVRMAARTSFQSRSWATWSTRISCRNLTGSSPSSKPSCSGRYQCSGGAASPLRVAVRRRYQNSQIYNREHATITNRQALPMQQTLAVDLPSQIGIQSKIPSPHTWQGGRLEDLAGKARDRVAVRKAALARRPDHSAHPLEWGGAKMHLLGNIIVPHCCQR